MKWSVFCGTQAWLIFDPFKRLVTIIVSSWTPHRIIEIERKQWRLPTQINRRYTHTHTSWSLQVAAYSISATSMTSIFAGWSGNPTLQHPRTWFSTLRIHLGCPLKGGDSVSGPPINCRYGRRTMNIDRFLAKPWGSISFSNCFYYVDNFHEKKNNKYVFSYPKILNLKIHHSETAFGRSCCSRYCNKVAATDESPATPSFSLWSPVGRLYTRHPRMAGPTVSFMGDQKVALVHSKQ